MTLIRLELWILSGLIVAGTLSLCGCKGKQSSDTSAHTTPIVQEFRAGDRLTSFAQEISSPTSNFVVKKGADHSLEITVKNTGTQPWFAGNGQALPVDAGYRWIQNGKPLIIDGNRAQLTQGVLQPGQSDSLQLRVSAPRKAGEYTLLVSMVQEGFTWFHDQGARPLTIQVTVN